MRPSTLTNDQNAAYRVAVLPLEYGETWINQLFTRGYNRYVVGGEDQPEDLLNDIERFGTAAFKEQVRTDAAEDPFVDEPGTLAVLATLSAICVKEHPEFEHASPRNIQVLYDIRELYVNNLASLIRAHGDGSLQQDIAEVLYSKAPDEDGPHPGRVCTGIEARPEFGDGLYLEIPMAAASRKCLVRAAGKSSTGPDDGGEILTRVKDNRLYVPVGDFDTKYRDYAERAFKKFLRVQEDGLSDDQLTWLTTNESGITDRIDRFLETGHHDRIWRNRDPGDQTIRMLRRILNETPDDDPQLGKFHTAKELYGGLKANEPDEWETSVADLISSPRSLASRLSVHESHSAVTIDRNGQVNMYRIGRAPSGAEQIEVMEIKDLFELPCMANLEKRLHEKKPVRKDLYNFVRMVMWLPQYRDGSLEEIVEDLKDVFSRWPWYDEGKTEYQVRYEFSNTIGGDTPLPMNCNNDDLQRYCIGPDQCPYSIWGSLPFPDEMYEQVDEESVGPSEQF